MLEITLVLTAVVAVGLVALLATVLTPGFMTVIALGTLLPGLVVGVPTGIGFALSMVGGLAAIAGALMVR